MDIEKIEKTVESISLPIINSLGYELVDVEFVNEEDEWYLRIYIDNAEGINIDDCTRVSRGIDALIDEADPIETGYYLEVSSPGPNRILKSEKDFEKFEGRKVKIVLESSFRENNEITGELKGFNSESITVNFENDIINIDRKNIREIRLNDF